MIQDEIDDVLLYSFSFRVDECVLFIINDEAEMIKFVLLSIALSWSFCGRCRIQPARIYDDRKLHVCMSNNHRRGRALKKCPIRCNILNTYRCLYLLRIKNSVI